MTFGLAIVVFFVTQYQGFRRHGFRGYVGSWLMPRPECPRPWPVRSTSSSSSVHIMGEIFKPLSLAVRLFANTVAGHLIILVMLGLHAAVREIHHHPAGRVRRDHDDAFEVFVAFIQAYIFSLLSVVYIEIGHLRRPLAKAPPDQGGHR